MGVLFHVGGSNGSFFEFYRALGFAPYTEKGWKVVSWSHWVFWRDKMATKAE